MSKENHNPFWSENINLKGMSFPRFMAAPLDGVTDSPLRRLIRHFSKKELLFSEMNHISAVANEKTGKLLRHNPIEQPLAFQISGSSTKFMAEAVEKIIEKKFVMINLNVGCPAKNVIKSGNGSALMAKPELLKKLLLELKKILRERIPLTIKIRAGFKEKNGLEIAKLSEDCGVEMLIIHPRTQPGGFSSRLDFDMVKKIKESLSIPIVFSGNIYDFNDAKSTYEKTGVDGFMIGRALWGCPWKIREITDAAVGKTFSMSNKEMIEYAIKHLELNMEFYGNHGYQAFKKQLPQYTKGLPHAATLRRELLRTQSYEEMRRMLEQLPLSHERLTKRCI